MQISLEWLSDFVELPPLDQLLDKLARAGIEIEEVHDPASAIAGVVVAEVKSCEPHPEADRLQVCEVFDGAVVHRVVCGAPNVAVGMKVAFARPPAELFGRAILARRVRGIESHGMLCSRAELGLEEKSAGIWQLPTTSELGAEVTAAMKVAPTLTLGITPNRPDLLSHLGVAREVAAASGKRLKQPVFRVTEKGPEVSSLARVLVDDAAGCKRYVARVVRNIKVGPSPEWLRTRLEQAGQRSINNVVDATNYVLLELGQPLHAFDLGRLAIDQGVPTVRVRRGKPGEVLDTLDDMKRELADTDLVIADANGPLALAGVMGGAGSEVSETTAAVLIESAYFEPTGVRKTARRHGMATESSRRFERGADIGMAQKAADRCAQLLVDIASGEVAKGVLEVAQKPEPPREITLRLERVGRLLGVEMPAETVTQLLEPLEIRCSGRNESSLRFSPPTFRPDVTREADLIEELARRYGYDRIPERLPNTGGPYVSEPLATDAATKASQTLIDLGLTEVVTFGFGNPAHYADALVGGGEPVRIINPLGEELSALRTSLLPGLLGVLGHNQRHGAKHVRIFEVGVTFRKREGTLEEDERDRGLPQECKQLGLLMFGGRAKGRWYEGGASVDFYDLAGVVDNLADAFDPQAPLLRRPGEIAPANPHCAAVLELAGTKVGWAAQLDPRLLTSFGVEGPVFYAELELASLEKARQAHFEQLPRFPGTRRDIAIIVERSLPAETLRDFLLTHAGGKLGREVVEDVRLFDVYSGKSIADQKVSLAFAIDYRSRERTLTDAEVGEAFAALQSELKRRFDVEIRSAS